MRLTDSESRVRFAIHVNVEEAGQQRWKPLHAVYSRAVPVSLGAGEVLQIGTVGGTGADWENHQIIDLTPRMVGLSLRAFPREMFLVEAFLWHGVLRTRVATRARRRNEWRIRVVPGSELLPEFTVPSMVWVEAGAGDRIELQYVRDLATDPVISPVIHRTLLSADLHSSAEVTNIETPTTAPSRAKALAVARNALFSSDEWRSRFGVVALVLWAYAAQYEHDRDGVLEFAIGDGTTLDRFWSVLSTAIDVDLGRGVNRSNYANPRRFHDLLLATIKAKVGGTASAQKVLLALGLDDERWPSSGGRAGCLALGRHLADIGVVTTAEYELIAERINRGGAR
jgi:hypothetical protein